MNEVVSDDLIGPFVRASTAELNILTSVSNKIRTPNHALFFLFNWLKYKVILLLTIISEYSHFADCFLITLPH